MSTGLVYTLMGLGTVMFFGAVLLLKGPMSQGVESSTGLRLNANNHPQPGTPEHAAMKAAWAKNKFHPKDPQRYSEFTSQLILRQGHEDWVAFNGSRAAMYFTPPEMQSLAEPYGKATCDTGQLPTHCCLGSSSLAGLVMWDARACQPDPLFRMLVPHAGRQVSVFRDMGDVLELGRGRNLTFVGDSMASQHAHAMECSWLRSGKAKTTQSDRIDRASIFDGHGGFDHKSRYGTSSEYTWITKTAASDVTTTVKFYMQYRPQQNMTEMRSIASQSDIMVVNFGLHYLAVATETFVQEMTALLDSLKTFAATPGKTLVWRETSAQHHLSEGGEFPAMPKGTGMWEVEWLGKQKGCFPLEFGKDVEPQWRDKLVLDLADKAGYRVHFLGKYDSPHHRKRHSTCHRPPSTTATVNGSSTDPSPEAAAAASTPHPPTLYWLPFFRVTSERSDLHPWNPAKNRTDCTHYCYTPYLWDPLVEGLAAAIEDSDRRAAGC